MHAGERVSAGFVPAAVKKRVRAAVMCVRSVAAAQDPSPRQVHRLRIATRRALAALGPLTDSPVPEVGKLLKRLRRIRKGAGRVRDADVHMQLLGVLASLPVEKAPANIKDVLHVFASDRAAAARDLAESLDLRVLRRVSRRCVQRLDEHIVVRAFDETLAALRAEFVAACSDAGRDIETLHRLRIAVKKIRYTSEMLGRKGEHPLIAQVQKRFGDVNDIATLVARLGVCADDIARLPECERTPATDRLHQAVADLQRRFGTLLEARTENALRWWHSQSRDTTPEQLFAEFFAQAPECSPQTAEEAPRTAALNGTHSRCNGAATAVDAAPFVAQALPPMPAPEAVQSSLWLAGLKIGVIDIGSNSIRLLVAEMIDDRSWRVLAEERVMTRLAHGQATSGNLSTETIAVSVEAIGRLKRAAESAGASIIRAFATAAVRDARNRADFLSLVHDRTGLAVELVSARDEGGMTFRSVARAFDLSEGFAAVIDIGGGSMEVVFSKDEVVYSNRSMRLGAVRLTELFGGSEAVAGSGYKALCRAIAKILRQTIDPPPQRPEKVIGCGGTFTTLLTLAAARRGVHLKRVSPALGGLDPVSSVELREILDDLRSRSLEERLRVPGLPPDRADIVIAGLAAIDRLMRHLDVEEVYCHTGGVREGLMLRVAEEAAAARFGEITNQPSRIAQDARALARRCRYERAHSEHVTDLSLSLFDQLMTESSFVLNLGEDSRERSMLQAAAILHDIGCSIEYRRHHKRSADMVRWAGLPSCTPRETELIAQICRYHRRAVPSMKHGDYQALGPRDRAIVARLAGILRVADALDRSHRQRVERVHLRFGREELLIEAGSTQQCREELAAAAVKSDLLASVVGAKVRFAVVDRPPCPAPAPKAAT